MIEIRCFDSAAPAFADELVGLLARNEEADSELMRSVARIIGEVREQGDAAVIKYTNRFDRRRARAADLEVPPAELQQALAAIPAELRTALESAAARIRAYHEKQLTESWSFEDADGVTLGQRVTPLDRVGVYVPGGKAAYPSTVLMSVIPGRVAGVGEMVMIVPAPDGELHPIVLAAAAIAGVDRVFSVGGAQGVAALAFGTETIPQVDKIVGPGNRYVAAAKRQVFGVVGIDMIAGPSEIVVVSDGTPDPDWVAMDLFAQAEHDEDARAILVSLDGDHLERVRRSAEKLLPGMERAAVIRAAMTRNGAFIRAHGIDEVAGIVNRIAPEHLQLAVAEPGPLLEKIRHAGAIFLGSHAAEVLGDYCAGPNHVLPTGRTARFSSPLGVYDFQKRSSIISCTAQGGAHLGGIAAVLARAEGLTAHARAAEFRIGGGKSGGPRQS